jgi:hypothetical protein
MTVPYTFGTQTGPIPLSELDANFSYLATSAPYYAQTAAEVSAGVIPTNYAYQSRPIIDVGRYGYVADGVTDNSTAINNAITVIKAAGGGVLQFPPGIGVVKTCLNFTQFGSTPIIFRGSGFDADTTAGTTLLCQTAADGTLSQGWCADFTGSQNVTIEEINFYGNGTNASTKGLLFARSYANQYAQQIRLIKSVVKLGNASSATSLGSIAIANCCAEQWVMDHCELYADVPYVMLLANDIGLSSAYVASTGHSDTGGIYTGILSMTVAEHRNCQFIANNYATSGVSMVLYGVANCSWRNCVWAKGGTTNANNYAISINPSSVGYQSCQDLDIEGQVETFPCGVTFATASQSAYRIKTHLFMPAAAAGVGSIVVTAANVALYNCVFDNHQTSNIVGSITAISFGASNSIYAGEICLYPSQTVLLNSVSNFGCRINYNGNGTGLLAISAGSNVASLGSPNGSQTYLDSEGFVHLNGILQSSAAITAGTTLATINAAHRPNRTLQGPAFLSGTGLVYYTITSGGLLSIGTNISGAGVQLQLDGISFRQTN